MYLRESTGTTLATLHDEVDTSGQETVPVSAADIQFRLTEETPVIRLGQREVPVTTEGILAFGDWLGVPAPFHKRIRKAVGPDFEQSVLTTLLERTAGTTASVTLTDEGVLRVLSPGQLVIEPVRLVNVAARLLGREDAPVERVVHDNTVFAFDVRVPEDHDSSVGGDRSALVLHPLRGVEVGDITAGGVRIELDRKRNLAPTVQPWVYRIACTNGAGLIDPSLKIDARGASVEDVLAEFEAMAHRAFSRIESQIEHFYALRHQRVENPERTLRRLAREHRIPDRSLMHLIDLVASEDMPDDPTMFDIVNLITNLANSPSIRRDGGRMLLENTGGAIITDHAARCGHCNSRLN